MGKKKNKEKAITVRTVEVKYWDESTHQYIVEEFADKTVIRYGTDKDATWAKPGKKAYTIKTDGNCNYFIEDHWNKEKVKINSIHAEALDVFFAAQKKRDEIKILKPKKKTKK